MGFQHVEGLGVRAGSGRAWVVAAEVYPKPTTAVALRTVGLQAPSI